MSRTGGSMADVGYLPNGSRSSGRTPQHPDSKPSSSVSSAAHFGQSVRIFRMNDYSVRGHARERQIYWLAALAFSAMPLLKSLSGWVGVTISVGTASLFAGIFWLFDRKVWRWSPVLKFLGFCDLNGTWDVVGQRLNPDGSTESDWSGQMTIVQTWSRIAIVLKSSQSRSISGPASLSREEGFGFRLLYTYSNEPEPDQPALRNHRGTCELVFSETCSDGTGVYFNDQQRLTFGRMQLKKNVSTRKESAQ